MTVTRKQQLQSKAKQAKKKDSSVILMIIRTRLILHFTRNRQSPTYENLKLRNFTPKTFLKRGPNFFLGERKRIETKSVEGYCWGITQAAGPSCSGRSASSVLEFVFQLESLSCRSTYAVGHIYTLNSDAQNSTCPGSPAM